MISNILFIVVLLPFFHQRKACNQLLYRSLCLFTEMHMHACGHSCLRFASSSLRVSGSKLSYTVQIMLSPLRQMCDVGVIDLTWPGSCCNYKEKFCIFWLNHNHSLLCSDWHMSLFPKDSHSSIQQLSDFIHTVSAAVLHGPHQSNNMTLWLIMPFFGERPASGEVAAKVDPENEADTHTFRLILLTCSL